MANIIERDGRKATGLKQIAMIAGLPEKSPIWRDLLVENTVTLDREWIDLMKEARDQGFTKEEIVEFLKNPVAKLNEVYMQKIVNS